MLVFTFSYQENFIILTGTFPKGCGELSLCWLWFYGMMGQGEPQRFSALVTASKRPMLHSLGIYWASV